MKYIYPLVILILLGGLYVLWPAPITDGIVYPSSCYKTHIFMYCKGLSLQENLALNPNETYYVEGSMDLLWSNKGIINSNSQNNTDISSIGSNGIPYSFIFDTYILVYNIGGPSTLYQKISSNYQKILSGDINIVTRVPLIGKDKMTIMDIRPGQRYIFDTISQTVFFNQYLNAKAVKVGKSIYQLESPLSDYLVINDVTYHAGIPIQSGNLIRDFNNLTHVKKGPSMSEYITDGEHLRYRTTYLGQVGLGITADSLYNASIAEDSLSYYINDKRYDKDNVGSMNEAYILYKKEKEK